MKLRLKGNSLRLRLTKSEVEQIGKGGLVEEKTVFPNQQIFSFSLLNSSKTNNLHAEFANGNIKVSLPRSAVEVWSQTEEVGIYGNCGELEIAVEKDFTCLTPRKGEDDTDTYPHPKEKDPSC